MLLAHRSTRVATDGRDLSTVVRALLSLFGVFSLVLALAGCSVQLSPAFDQATYSDLAELNVKTETLFASLSRGSSRAEFAKYEETYDQLIGGFSAARMATAARPVPDAPPALLASGLKTVCGDDIADCSNPTPHHLDKVIVLLTAMRDAHQDDGLVGELVNGFNGRGGFKGQYEIDMNPVLIFEAALQR